MAIRKRETRTMGTRWQVRVHEGRGRYRVIGTYPTERAARAAEAAHHHPAEDSPPSDDAVELVIRIRIEVVR